VPAATTAGADRAEQGGQPVARDRGPLDPQGGAQALDHLPQIVVARGLEAGQPDPRGRDRPRQRPEPADRLDQRGRHLLGPHPPVHPQHAGGRRAARAALVEERGPDLRLPGVDG
jgi:hypothetical protein